MNNTQQTVKFADGTEITFPAQYKSIQHYRDTLVINIKVSETLASNGHPKAAAWARRDRDIVARIDAAS